MLPVVRNPTRSAASNNKGGGDASKSEAGRTIDEKPRGDKSDDVRNHRPNMFRGVHPDGDAVAAHVGYVDAAHLEEADSIYVAGIEGEHDRERGLRRPQLARYLNFFFGCNGAAGTVHEPDPMNRFALQATLADLIHSPATCRVATLSRFQTLVTDIQRSSEANCGSV